MADVRRRPIPRPDRDYLADLMRKYGHEPVLDLARSLYWSLVAEGHDPESLRTGRR